MVQKPAGREAVAQPADQLVGQLVLPRAQGGGVPLGGVHVVDRDERRLAAHGQPHVAALQVGVDLVAQRLDLGPLLVGVRLGDARVFVDARDRHREAELVLAVGVAGAVRGAVAGSAVTTSSSSNEKNPVMAAAVDGSAEQASGMCPSPASRPDVGSSPTHPAPGR